MLNLDYDATFDENNEEEDTEDTEIRWSNLLFLPFHPIFKGVVIIMVVIKTILGPVQSVYPIVYCWETMDVVPLWSFIKFLYLYCCDPIYGLDTFLHMLHRQVTEEAMRREYLPKSAFLLFLDILSLIPFHRIMAEDVCAPVTLWPNLLSFSEFLIIYRVADAFSLITTHKFIRIVCGFTIILGIGLNCLASFFLLLTAYGLCENCKDGNYDWQHYVIHKLNETDHCYSSYVYGLSVIFSYVVNKQYDEIKPSTLSEFIIISILAISGNILLTFIVFPKMVAEALLKFRRINVFYPQVKRVVEETKRRNPTSNAYKDVKHFYELMWIKRNGITMIPEVISELPRYLRIDIRQDLVWPVFYHSPTLRKTSSPFKRWLSEYVRIDFKLPDEKFFAGPHCHSHLCYLKSGIVQLFSTDDGSTPLISMTSGTIFGDINFLLPPLKRKVFVRCLTFCEVLYISRMDFLNSLHKYPEDRRMIMDLTKDRIKHAHTLYTCKQHVRGLDRTEDEGIAWVKRRWWEISEVVAKWKKKSLKKEGARFELPAEETAYHCAKYIGQLVLCSDIQLQMKSMFANVKFPWIFVPESTFGTIWKRIVIATVFCVLLLYPPYVTRNKIPKWFKFFQFWTDLIYVSDIIVSLLTSVVKGENVTDNFATVMFTRCKSTKFVLDVLSTIWIENLALICGVPKIYAACQFNRLIKIYVLFTKWDINKKPLYDVCYKIVLIQFSFAYIISYILFILDRKYPNLTTSYFFGEVFCKKEISDDKCDFERGHPLNVMLAWSLEFLFFEYLPNTLEDIYLAIFITYISFITYVYCKTNLVASLYLKYREICNYQYFVSNIKSHYKHHKIHPDLLKRLNRYLVCHWKYYNGMDVMHPNFLKNEPYDIYWKVHGEVAERVIHESRAFISADAALIRELAYKGKFMVLPKNSTIILFGLQCKNVSWIVQGSVVCEYPDENGNLVKKNYNPGELLTSFGVFFGTVSLRTLSASTECEILYIKTQDFKKILQRYPHEWAYIQDCVEEFSPSLDVMVNDYVEKHRNYHDTLRRQIFHARKSGVTIPIKSVKDSTSIQKPEIGNACLNPESSFVCYWMLFRAIVVPISIFTTAIQGGSGACFRMPFVILGEVCDVIALIDIIIKMFVGYYNDRGLLITSLPKVMKHYMSRGFIFDLIGCLPCHLIFNLFTTKTIGENDGMLVNTLSKFAHLYLLMGYFNYAADMPNVNFAYAMIFKWLVVSILAMMGSGHYFVTQCIDFEWNSKGNLESMSRRNHCWLPNYLHLAEKPTIYQLHMVYAESLNLAQCGFMRFNLGKFQIDREHLGVGFLLFLLGFMFWYVMCYSLTLLVLNYRGNTLFQHGVNQLRRFLKAERVDNKLIKRAVAHFRYWWLRTKGINIQNLMHERIGVIFRQDLSYYFFKKTVEATDSLLGGGSTVERDLASAATQIYFLPNEVIVREMDLTPYVFIVHRGNIMVKQNDEDVMLLSKGSIFGQLDKSTPRPLRISAVSTEYADLLQIPIKEFQDIIGDKGRKNIAKNPQAKDDYMCLKKAVLENPYNTVKYLLRRRKAIKLPWMKERLKAKSGTWYSRCLYFTWFIGPVAVAILTCILLTVPRGLLHTNVVLLYMFLILDIVHILHIIMDFYSTELVVIDENCVDVTIRWGILKKWQFYIDIISVISPIVGFIARGRIFTLPRLLRLRLLYDFHQHFCKGFESNFAPIVLKFTTALLLLHSMTCGWIHIACRSEEFPLEIPVIPSHVNASIDYSEWTSPSLRKEGCARLTRNYIENDKNTFSFLVPINWVADYIVAMLYIIIIYTHTEVDVVVALTLKQIYYKLYINFIIYPTEIWILSVAISAVYTKFRELYAYDYDVNILITSLRDSGLSPTLLQSVREYTKQLWQRQRGNWLPELAQQAPECLREDLLGSLYMHHLHTAPLFRDLPEYFNRQLVARLKRVVVFPGKYIVQEGDILSLMYFIHEGEVEKWYTDKNGERKLLSVLNTNGYFGLLPGLFPNTPFQFSYFSRTVVDLVFLRHRDWQDLLDGYPDVREKLFAAARQYKKDVQYYI
ncbi:unnamed protein product [Euphydryas editha]|uniref:Cyclic nucleotide-binding domain-containing protein n=1 Tax=Euphydryas editha TaxID=104508 RepID=A0AAU9UF36_EUPED|nr:unnamed protein product [Euphydryas editha]